MSERIDHASEALRVLNLPGSPDPVIEANAMSYAQVHATLALVEQQRIANRIALASTVAAVEMKYMQNGCRAHLSGETGLFDYTSEPDGAQLKPEIKEGLGL